MNSFSLNKYPENSHIHFIAIGGISMSGLAEILLKRGFKVSGSDSQKSHITDKLEALGAKIYIGQKKENITSPDLVVYSAAIKPDNPEFEAATKSGAEIIDRATLLGAIMKEYRFPVAVSGTHGKTTTTSLMSHIMLAANSDPTISIGGELASIGGNIRVGSNDYFICEACEYHQSFLKFFPKVSIILNIEADHLDYFKDLDHIINTFSSLVDLTPEDGACVVNIDNENVKTAIAGHTQNIITCSMTNGDYVAKNITFEKGVPSFDVYEKGEFLGKISLSVCGEHNIMNSLCTVAAARFLGLEFSVIAEGIADFSGVGRRFEQKGIKNGVTVIDDYAHHPTEIETTLKSALAKAEGEVFCVFQPHTYTRTYTLFDDFVKVLSGQKNLIITDIYAAREKDTGLVSARQLAEPIEGAIYIPSFSDCVDFLEKNTKEGDLVITMGAGNVYKIGDDFLCK